MCVYHNLLNAGTVTEKRILTLDTRVMHITLLEAPP